MNHRRFLAYTGAIALASTIAITGAPAAAHADEIRDNQWYLETLGINDAHELSQGEGVTIGVIDSGIDATHPDLANNVVEGKGYGDADSEALEDSGGHGTSIASILAGHGHGDNGANGILGIAPKAKIVPVAMHCDDDKCTGADPRDWWDEAFEYLMEQDVDIISVSMNYSNDGSDVVTQAADKGIPVVGSAGNSTTDYGAELGVQEQNRVSWPARTPNAIPVSGVNQDGEFWEDSQTLDRAAQHPKYGLSAPATDLPGAMPGGDYSTNSGTSGSAPIVAGTLALIKSAYPDLDYQTWLERMLGTVDDKGDEGFDDEYGWGIVDPLEALTEDINYDDGHTKLESLAEDRLPLEEQGKDTGNDGSEDGSDEDAAADGNPIAAATGGMPAWLIITIVAGLLIVTAAIITAVVLAQRRKKRHTSGIPDGPGPAPATAVHGSAVTHHNLPGAGPPTSQQIGTGSDQTATVSDNVGARTRKHQLNQKNVSIHGP